MKNGKYTLITPPSSFPGKRYRGRYAYEHIVVWWQNFGMPKEGEVIHHKNGNHRDNKIENLELLTNEQHGRVHAKPAKMISLTCTFCGMSFIRPNRFIKEKQKKGQKRFYCCRSHQVRQMWKEGTAFSGKYTPPDRAW